MLESFLGYLAQGDYERAYRLVAPSSKKQGDPIAYRARLDYEAFLRELRARSRRKFVEYALGNHRWESPSRFRIKVIFPAGDIDEALIVREEKGWYVADPIHIIR